MARRAGSLEAPSRAGSCREVRTAPRNCETTDGFARRVEPAHLAVVAVPVLERAGEPDEETPGHPAPSSDLDPLVPNAREVLVGDPPGPIGAETTSPTASLPRRRRTP
jgi:hypothetical protein